MLSSEIFVALRNEFRKNYLSPYFVQGIIDSVRCMAAECVDSVVVSICSRGFEVAREEFGAVAQMVAFEITNCSVMANLSFSYQQNSCPLDRFLGENLDRELGDYPIYNSEGIFLGAISVRGADPEINDLIAEQSVCMANLEVGQFRFLKDGRY